MLTYVQGNLLEANVEALVNPVNCVGTMGKGLAKSFSTAFPTNFLAYKAACKKGQVRVGKMFVTTNPFYYGPTLIVNFPTKDDWRNPSQLGWIEDGLLDLVRVIREAQIHSIAVPSLGCGNGGLDWEIVRPLIEGTLQDLPGVDVLVYEPIGG